MRIFGAVIVAMGGRGVIVVVVMRVRMAFMIVIIMVMIVVVIVIVRMLFMRVPVLCVVMVMLEQRAVAGGEMRSDLGVEQRQRGRAAGNGLDLATDARRQFGADPDHQIRILKAACLRRGQGVVMRRGALRHQEPGSPQIAHDRGGQTLHGRDIGDYAWHFGAERAGQEESGEERFQHRLCLVIV